MNSVAAAQTFHVDFSQWSGPPLVKTKFGVYQTPLVTLPDLLRSASSLQEINIQGLRYEMGWGKLESLASDQISGTAQQPQIDFSALDAFTRTLADQHIKALFALTYCPTPLKSRPEWAGWKDLPNDLRAWQHLVHSYVAHLCSKPAMAGSLYEVWNEPDMPEPNGKMFFSGTPQDYLKLYAASAAGVRQADPDARVGGAALAYDLRYFTPLLSLPPTLSLDFASIHAYDNYASQLNNLRGAVGNRPELPLLLTEYASFTDMPPNGPQSRHPAAARFFRDVRGMLNLTDLAKVYWAQWVDAGHSPGMGLLTWDGHRKALFNAFKIYGRMPVDRSPVTPDGEGGVNVVASSDTHTAGVVIWNETAAERTVTLHLKRLAFTSGTLQTYRIDARHGSYVDNIAAEDLQAEETAFQHASEVTWTGKVPAESVVYLSAFDASGSSLLTPASIGTCLQSHYWFADRHSGAYSDFDPRTAIARLGMGDSDVGVAQIGSVIEHPANRFTVQVAKQGSFHRQDNNTLFGLRIDFASRRGGYSKSVLLHSGLFSAKRTSVLPWGRGAAVADVCLFRQEMNTGKPFLVDLSRLAPANWDRKRILISFLLQNASRGSQARLLLRKKM